MSFEVNVICFFGFKRILKKAINKQKRPEHTVQQCSRKTHKKVQNIFWHFRTNFSPVRNFVVFHFEKHETALNFGVFFFFFCGDAMTIFFLAICKLQNVAGLQCDDPFF